MKEEHRRTLLGVISDSCSKLFEAYGVSLTRQPFEAGHALEEVSMVGVIGFTHPKLRGSLVLAAAEAPLRASNHVTAPPRDWIAELANQLLGRAKNRLLAYDLELQMSTPLALAGSHIRLVNSERGMEPEIFTTPAGGVVAVWFDGEASADLELVERSSAPEVANEGELMLF